MQSSCSNENRVYGGFFVRLAAYLIDSIIVGIGLIAVRLVIAGVFHFLPDALRTQGILFHYTLKQIILYLCGAAYFILLTYHTGTTLGKRLMNLKVIKAGNERLTLFDVIYRETIGRFLCGFIFCIGYIMAGVDAEKKGLHDVLCDTRVVYDKRIKVTYIQPPQMVYRTNTGYMPPTDGKQEGTSQNETRGL